MNNTYKNLLANYLLAASQPFKLFFFKLPRKEKAKFLYIDGRVASFSPVLDPIQNFGVNTCCAIIDAKGMVVWNHMIVLILFNYAETPY